ncbi:unnamed protein product, partial [Adineta steineri]
MSSKTCIIYFMTFGNLQLPLTTHSSDDKQTLSNQPSIEEVPPNSSDVSFTSLKKSLSGMEFHSVPETTDGIHTQTESMASNDAAVNT